MLGIPRKMFRYDVKFHKDAFLSGLITGLQNLTTKGKRLIIAHVGSNSGFLPGGLWVLE